MIKLSDLKVNPANPRLIKDYRFKKLIDSVRDFPRAMPLRPIIVDNDGMILGGNMRYKALLELKYKEIPDTWVRKAEELTDDEKRRFIILDNISFGEMDFDMLANEWDEKELLEWGFELPNFGEESDEKDDIYSRKVEIPIYEPKKEKPKVGDLCDEKKMKDLIAEIQKTDLPKEEKAFLIAAANRHRVFNYEMIADYYAHSAPEVQDLMEKSALVIIDFNKAIANGYVHLAESIKDQYAEDYADEK